MTELLIGGRKSRRVSTVRAATLSLAVGLAAMVVAWFIYGRSVSYDLPDGPAATEPVTVDALASEGAPRLRFGSASVQHVGGITVLRISGEAHDLGAATGRLLAESIRTNLKPLQQSIVDACASSGMFASMTSGMRLDWRTRFLDDGMLDRDQRWLAGIVRGASASGVDLDYSTLLRTQTSLDVGAPSLSTDEGELRTLSRALSFVIPQPGPTSDRVWVGHNLALPGLIDGGDAARESPLLTIAHPAGRISWASVGWPGLSGVVSGLNASGVLVIVHPARTRDIRITRTARPTVMLAREVLEQANDLDEAIKLLRNSTSLGSARFVLVDGKLGSWAIVERTPGKSQVIRDPRQPAVGDLLTGSAFVDDPENDRARRLTPSTSRIERLERLLTEPPQDLAAAAAVLRDKRLQADVVEPVGHRGVPADLAAVQSVLFDPSAMVVWIADGAPGARMRAFDLSRELRGDTSAAPPAIADIPAEEGFDPQLPERLAAARGYLREARTFLVAGNTARAMELAARGLELMPDLPEAMGLVGRIARASGDPVLARTMLDKWLASGADLPQAAEEARMYLSQ